MSRHSQPEKVTAESLDSSPACLDVILSSLHPFFLVTEIFLQFIKLEKLIVNINVERNDK